MQRLIHRYGLSAVIAGGVAMFAVTASALILAVVTNSHASTISRRYTTTQRAVYSLCIRRETLERRLRALERNDVWLQRTLIRIEGSNPSSGASLRVAAYRRKLVSDRRYLASPVEDGCELLLPH